MKSIFHTTLLFLLLLPTLLCAQHKTDSLFNTPKWNKKVLVFPIIPTPALVTFSQSFYMQSITTGCELIIKGRHSVRIPAGYFIPNIVAVGAMIVKGIDVPSVNHGPHLGVRYAYFPLSKPYKGPRGFYLGPYVEGSYVMTNKMRDAFVYYSLPYKLTQVLVSAGLELGYHIPVDAVLIDVNLSGGYKYARAYRLREHHFESTAPVFQQDMFYNWPFTLAAGLGVLF